MPDAKAGAAELIARLGSADRSVQKVACDEAVRRLRDEPGLRDSLLEQLNTGPPHARFAAAFVLFHGERPGLRLLPALLDSLELADGDLRWSAVHMLTALGRLQLEVLPVLLHECARGAKSQRRRMALYAVRELAPERPETQRALLEALRDPDTEVRRAALSSFAKLREPEREALEQVLRVLADDADPRMRRIAAVLVPELLARHPDAAVAGRSALERAAGDADPDLARAAGAALLRL